MDTTLAVTVDTLLAPGDSDGSDDDDGGGMRRWGNIALPLAEDLLLDAVVDDDGCCTPLFSLGGVYCVSRPPWTTSFVEEGFWFFFRYGFGFWCDYGAPKTTMGIGSERAPTYFLRKKMVSQYILHAPT